VKNKLLDKTGGKIIVLRIEQLTKSYQSGEKRNIILEKLDFSVIQNDFVVIMGKSGSGKTTLLYCLGLIDDIDSGTISLNGKRIDNLGENEKAKIRLNEFGFVFQDMNLINMLTLKENIAMPSYEQKTYSSENVDKLIDSFGLTDFADKKPDRVSGGEKQRAAIARAIINHPKILFADEPTGSLDYQNSLSLLNLFKKMNNEGQTLVIVSHDRLVASYAKKIYFLQEKKIRQILEFDQETEEERFSAIDKALLGLD